MIKFERIRYKNLLSTGEQWTNVDLSKNALTAIVGKNGSGKTSLIDSLTFVLFDKPFRKITKGRLVNSINGKGLLVEVNFSIGQTEFMVRRGIKPNKFEIYKNKELIDQNGSSRDYQEHLEKHILKLNFKSFTQVVVLGSTTFIPFMELGAADRRSIVEDLLDIEIFSKMNILAKAKLSCTKHDIMELQSQCQIIQEKMRIHRTNITNLLEEKKRRSSDSTEQIKSLNKDVEKLTETVNKLQNKVDLVKSKITKAGTIREIRERLTGTIREKKVLMGTHQKTIDFFDRNDECPTCTQNINKQFKDTILKQNKDEIKKYEEAVNDNEYKLDLVLEKLGKVDKALSIIRETEIEISKNNSKISSNNSLIQSLNKEAEKDDNSNAIDKAKNIYKKLDGELLATGKLLNNKETSSTEYSVVVNLLKDSGIKTQIIKQYLPVMNKYINEYIERMNFEIAFEIDEEFNETIKSRYRDYFQYSNFSEGEKQRINLALLLTWRNIAQMRNSAATNLLILDEVFDSSLDEEGTEGFMEILRGFGEDANVFIVSHDKTMHDRFENVLEFFKDGNFSHMKESEKENE